MKEAKLRMEDALAATRAAVEEGIICGGGAAYIHASKDVEKLVDTLEGDERTGAKVILKALESPLFHIASNAGLEGAVIINKVHEAEKGIGFDALKEEYVDMVDQKRTAECNQRCSYLPDHRGMRSKYQRRSSSDAGWRRRNGHDVIPNRLYGKRTSVRAFFFA